MIQWHPLFVQLLRPVVEDYYDIETNVAVGDVPREADVMLLRRTQSANPPFEVVWKYLTPWNVLEYKGPSVSARVNDLRLLLELGLGIYRKVNEERVKGKQQPVTPEEVSFWYIRHTLGKRFCKGVQALLRANALERVADGIWTCRVFDHLVYLVGGQALPFGRESFPLQFLHAQPPAWDRAAAELLLGEPALQKSCESVLPGLHPGLFEEIDAMARTKTKWPPKPDPERLGGMMEGLIELIGTKRAIDKIGIKRVIDEVGLDKLLSSLSPGQLTELKRRLGQK